MIYNKTTTAMEENRMRIALRINEVSVTFTDSVPVRDGAEDKNSYLTLC